jgi:hypothetical protein
MTWNYRVVHRCVCGPLGDFADVYAIHEVYYRDDGTPYAVSNDPDPMLGETLEELRTARLMMSRAFREPVLEYDQIGETAS